MKQILFLLMFLLNFLLSGCTSFFIVKSDAGKADVFYIDSKKGDKKELGQTPLQMEVSELRKKTSDEVGSGEFFTIVVEKQGYITQTFNIPTTRFGMYITQLDVKLKEGKLEQEKKLAKDNLDRLFLAQKLALNQQYERAQIEIDKILNDFPGFAKALSMRASIYYIQKNYVESIKWYEEALKADPQMEETIKMLSKVKSLQSGNRIPTSNSDTNKGGTP